MRPFFVLKKENMTVTDRRKFIFDISLATGVMALSIASLSLAYRTLARLWQVSAVDVQWLTTVFMLTMCLTMPLSPWLFNNIPFKKLFAGLLLTFELGTLLIIFAPDFAVALLGRILEAAAIGILFPTYQAALMLITPLKQRGTVMGLAGLVMSLAIAGGPVLTGFVLAVLTWRELFWLYFALTLLALILSPFTISNIVKLNPSSFDWLSFVASWGLAGLLYCLTECKQIDSQKPALLLLALISLLATAFFIHRQFKLDQPILALKALKNLKFDFSLFLSGTAYSSMIMVTVVFPIYYQRLLHVTAGKTALTLLLPTLLLSLFNLLGGHWADQFGYGKIMLTGMVAMIIGFAIQCCWQRQLSLAFMLVLACLIEGGSGLVMMPATTFGVNCLPASLMAHGTAIITTMRQLMGSLSSTLIAILLTNYGQAQGYFPIFALFALANLVIASSLCWLKN